MQRRLTVVCETAPGCDVSVDPDSCPAVVRSPYYAEAPISVKAGVVDDQEIGFWGVLYRRRARELRWTSRF
jgi:hypothetical protein